MLLQNINPVKICMWFDASVALILLYVGQKSYKPSQSLISKNVFGLKGYNNGIKRIYDGCNKSNRSE